ncbi:heat-inducible transcriptional repressor HrcA [Paenibacillus sp. 1011MAR3C5]|uniref:heat-inducible transcriptional repressor HrcA n=1 Tax=Paenibacillus sp. 1011MAR3C5 TaxID=1675787 RepID=UPI000E6C5BAD|nr:heat-inducible transcriptional repressor HrcA [Paenibacillus sp. 1011MAR3C5]RJE89860.1 heat-inducible transcriptional repressor HrcA [Paenibacillus sp. 1011MAR3C5]
MLTDRQRMILHAIVDDYIRSAEPVGSRSISKRGDVAFSPATIRNEMADLEELGFLEQPHTSAGRVPSTKGYRYYVDHLIQLKEMKEEDLGFVRSFVTEKMNQMEQVIQQAATVLSSLTNYTSIMLGPELFHTSLKHFGLVPLNASSAVAIIVTNTGHVENRTITIPPGLNMDDMQKVVNILNTKLVGVPLVRLKAKLYSEVGQELERHVDHYESLISVLDSALQSDVEQRIFMSGATNMLTQPEFKDVDKVKTILDLLDETPTIMKMFSSLPSGIQVRIGTENDHKAISDCSLITATYSIDGESLGTIGILGPTRMEYGKVISMLDLISKDMSVLLSRWYR